MEETRTQLQEEEAIAGYSYVDDAVELIRF